MTISLDNQAITLGKTHSKALYEALLSAFTVSELDRLVYFELQEYLEQITLGASGSDVIFKFVQWLERQGRMVEFVRVAYKANPRNAQLHAIAKDLGFVADAPPKERLTQMLEQFAREFDMVADLSPDQKFERMLEAFARELNLHVAPQVSSQTGLERLITRRPNADLPRLLRWLSNAAQRVCRIEEAGQPRGTGFLVGSDRVLTAFHIVAHLMETGRWSSCQCRFDYMQQDGSINRSELAELSVTQPLIDFSPFEQSSESSKENGLDYALLRLAQPVAETRGWYSLADVVSAPENTMIYLVHHPNGMPLKVSQPPGKLYRYNPHSTRYEYFQVASAPGSGGAPCFDEYGNLIAMHHAANRNRMFEGDDVGLGIPLTAIRDSLIAHGIPVE